MKKNTQEIIELMAWKTEECYANSGPALSVYIAPASLSKLMNSLLEYFQQELKIANNNGDTSPHFLAEIALLACTEEDVYEVVKFLSTNKTGANEAFWNHAR